MTFLNCRKFLRFGKRVTHATGSYKIMLDASVHDSFVGDSTKAQGFQHVEEHMQAFPSFDGTSACVRVVCFKPFANPAAMARKKYVIQAQLAQERGKHAPDALLIKAYEIWLRVYQRNIANTATGDQCSHG